MNAVTLLERRQRAWAVRHQRVLDDDGYVGRVEENLYLPLDQRTAEEFRRADGDELGGEGRRGKMLAVHSSSALVVNAFMPLRGHARLAADLLVPGSTAESFVFESQHPVISRAANLDLEFDGPADLAVEAKFLEPYRKRPSFVFADRYSDPGRWDLLPRCGALATGGGLGYRHLDAAQLLKHLLGLARARGHRDRVRLVYLWYEVTDEHGQPHPESAEHRREVSEFASRLDDGLLFHRLTYQELFARMKGRPGIDPAHYAYLEDRYIRQG
jgi:hypothetical protein